MLRKEIEFVYKTFSGVSQQGPQSNTTFLFRVYTFPHITNVLQYRQQHSSHQRHPSSSGKPPQIRHPLLPHPFL